MYYALRHYNKLVDFLKGNLFQYKRHIFFVKHILKIFVITTLQRAFVVKIGQAFVAAKQTGFHITHVFSNGHNETRRCHNMFYLFKSKV